MIAASEISGIKHSRQMLQNVTITGDDMDEKGILNADDVTITGLDAGTFLPRMEEWFDEPDEPVTLQSSEYRDH